MNILEIFINSILLIITFDIELWDIIILSLFVSFTGLIIASILGFLIGYFFALYNFHFKRIILVILNHSERVVAVYDDAKITTHTLDL